MLSIQQLTTLSNTVQLSLDSYLIEHKCYYEAELIQHLSSNQNKIFPQLDATDQFQMFWLHFVLYNALFCLQKNWFLDTNEYRQLQVGLAKCEITFCSNQHTAFELSVSIQQAEYYLNWENLLDKTPTEVDEMLAQFWHFYQQTVSSNKLNDALIVFSLKSLPTAIELKKRYKQLCVIHHPDKGGNPIQFQKIQSAWEILNLKCK